MPAQTSASERPHPAKFSKELRPVLLEMVGERSPVLDPMAGVGTLGLPGLIHGELEPEWAAQCPSPAYVGDATKLPFRDETFEAIVTSPAYGNRMADRYAGDAKGSRRHTYRIYLDRPLTAGSGAGLQWGAGYRRLHLDALREWHRVLRPGGVLVLNMKDHYRGGRRQHVVRWWVGAAKYVGFVLEDARLVETPGQRDGANGSLRVDFEVVLRLRREV